MGAAKTEHTPLDEAISRLEQIHPAMLGFELLLSHIDDVEDDGEPLNGKTMAALIRPHVNELASVLDELRAERRAKKPREH